VNLPFPKILRSFLTNWVTVSFLRTLMKEINIVACRTVAM
jgi:hypothetical protein